MCSRFLIKLVVGTTIIAQSACNWNPHTGAQPAEQPNRPGVIDSALDPGVDHSLVTTDPRAMAYYDNAEAVNTGKRLFQQYNCSGCHSNGGGGMGPDLMDDVWIYGGRLEQIHQPWSKAVRTACLRGVERYRMNSCGSCRCTSDRYPCRRLSLQRPTIPPHRRRRRCLARWIKTRAGHRRRTLPTITRPLSRVPIESLPGLPRTHHLHGECRRRLDPTPGGLRGSQQLAFFQPRARRIRKQDHREGSERSWNLVSYVWWAQRRGYVRNTLNDSKCDVWPGMASGVNLAATTHPYYRSTYVFVTREEASLAHLTLDDPRLKSASIGVQMIGNDSMNTPPAHAIASRGIVANVRGYMVYGTPVNPM